MEYLNLFVFCSKDYALKEKYFCAKKLKTVVIMVLIICEGVAQKPHISTKNFKPA